MLRALDMFSIGIGPSSSHTVGPMRAAKLFVEELQQSGLLHQVKRITVDLYGSLALTGDGHGTIDALLNGLSGYAPDVVDADEFIQLKQLVSTTSSLCLLGVQQINFTITNDIVLHKGKFLPQHANGMEFSASFIGNVDTDDYRKQYFSVGGGFVVDDVHIKQYLRNTPAFTATTSIDTTIIHGSSIATSKHDDMMCGSGDDAHEHSLIPYKFSTASELFGHCLKHKLSIADVVMANELVFRTKDAVKKEALAIVAAMRHSVHHGIHNDGELPGGLQVKRRAKRLYQQIKDKLYSCSDAMQHRQMAVMVYAMAVNEENAAFRRIVTAPTNGAAGTIPAVLEYYYNFVEGANEDKLVEFILTAGAIGMLYKFGASISAAEVGCQGEIGVACSMAAGALTACMGGNLAQIEKSAEIAMEHSLGMTCDPINGLVQIPCIERNAIAASKAIDITRLSLLEDTPGKISLDQIIKTMFATGKDMHSNYKETALGGLAINTIAVNMVSC